MPRPGSIIPKVPLAKIMQDTGAKRVSADAVDELNRYLIDYAMKISKRASKIAKHTGRKTIKAEDINLALE